jgi:hypothetical protein
MLVTLIGLSTLLWGVVYVGIGVYLTIAGGNAAKRFVGGGGEDMAGGLGPFLAIIFELIAFVGICLILAGAAAMVAGLGVLLRKQWGRILTFVVSGLVLLLGLCIVTAYQEGAGVIALGAAHVLYAVLVIVVLGMNGSEFARN